MTRLGMHRMRTVALVSWLCCRTALGAGQGPARKARDLDGHTGEAFMPSGRHALGTSSVHVATLSLQGGNRH